MYTNFTNDSLSFILEGTEQILSFRAKIKIDKKTITNVQWCDRFNEWPSMQVRMPGSYLPSWIMAGSYWSDEGWDFVLAKKPKGLMQPVLFDVLVIETNVTRYRRVILRMEKSKAEEVINWWKA